MRSKKKKTRENVMEMGGRGEGGVQIIFFVKCKKENVVNKKMKSRKVKRHKSTYRRIRNGNENI